MKIVSENRFSGKTYFYTIAHSSVNSRKSEPPPPTIISRGETIRAAIGERVVLPCQVKNLGEQEEEETVKLMIGMRLSQ